MLNSIPAAMLHIAILFTPAASQRPLTFPLRFCSPRPQNAFPLEKIPSFAVHLACQSAHDRPLAAPLRRHRLHRAQMTSLHEPPRPQPTAMPNSLLIICYASAPPLQLLRFSSGFKLHPQKRVPAMTLHELCVCHKMPQPARNALSRSLTCRDTRVTLDFLPRAS